MRSLSFSFTLAATLAAATVADAGQTLTSATGRFADQATLEFAHTASLGLPGKADNIDADSLQTCQFGDMYLYYFVYYPDLFFYYYPDYYYYYYSLYMPYFDLYSYYFPYGYDYYSYFYYDYYSYYYYDYSYYYYDPYYYDYYYYDPYYYDYYYYDYYYYY